MAPMSMSVPDESETSAWPLQSFTVNHDFKSRVPTQLYLDRANGEFGIVTYDSLSTATMVQFTDDEPVYFQAKIARAASFRSKCRKISLLFQHMQIDLEFTSPEQARTFLNMVEDISMAAGNHFFYTYEVPG
jgi:hypothetical protein